ncbi:MAG: lysine biosynthesis protein LysW [Anaerolineae bacterium]|jgi:alpha-aminoadipate carrier protein LysW
MVTVFCIECEQAIKIDSRLEEGEIVYCSHCGAELEVINLEPTELDWVYLDPIRSEDKAKRPSR